MSITFRQTNVIWVLFFMVWSIVKELQLKNDAAQINLTIPVIYIRTVRKEILNFNLCIINEAF